MLLEAPSTLVGLNSLSLLFQCPWEISNHPAASKQILQIQSKHTESSLNKNKWIIKGQQPVASEAFGILIWYWRMFALPHPSPDPTWKSWNIEAFTHRQSFQHKVVTYFQNIGKMHFIQNGNLPKQCEEIFGIEGNFILNIK